MTVTITQNYISQFSNNLFHLLTQQGSKLKGLFPSELAKGQKHFFDRLGQFSASPVLNRLEDVVLQDGAHSRRMATVTRYAANAYLDDIDKLQMLIDPTNDYAIELANAHGKNFDEQIVSALLGSAAGGYDGSSSTSFDSNQVISATSGGLTVAKFNKALRILQSNEVDLDAEKIYLLVTARGIEGLMDDSTYTSFFYRDVKPLDSKVNNMMFRNVQIVHTERLPEVTSGTTGRAIMCTERALKVAMAKDMEIKVAERPDLNFAQQISTYMFFGAVRMEEKRVVDLQFTY